MQGVGGYEALHIQSALAIVGTDGEAYLALTEYDVGTYEIPISLRYDKRTGITDGTSNLTTYATFTGLELFNCSVNSESAALGTGVLFSGYVRYAHDQSLVSHATIALNGEAIALADENGYFEFQEKC